jgi:hypothetical protein
MSALVEYIAGRGEIPSRRELNRIIESYEWFTTARRARALVTGEVDARLTLPLMFRPTVPPRPRRISLPEKEAVALDVIDRFIEHGGYRIVPSDEVAAVEVDIDIDPEMVTPELAEIYRAQGLEAEAQRIDEILRARSH